VQPKPSFLVKIPRRGNSLLGGGDTSVAGTGNGSPSGHPGPADAILSQPAGERRPAPAPGYGKLPSLGGN